MARYPYDIRSSYFYLKNEEAEKEYELLMKQHILIFDFADDDAHIEYSEKRKDGRIQHAFRCESSILGYIDITREEWENISPWCLFAEKPRPDFDKFLEKLSVLIADNSECSILTPSYSPRESKYDFFIYTLKNGKVLEDVYNFIPDPEIYY